MADVMLIHNKVDNRKKIKTDHLGIDDAVEGADDSDNDVHDDNNVCTSSYCPPCYELA